MKKHLALLLAAAVSTMGLAGCASSDPAPATTETPAPAATTTTEPAKTPETPAATVV